MQWVHLKLVVTELHQKFVDMTTDGRTHCTSTRIYFVVSLYLSNILIHHCRTT